MIDRCPRCHTSLRKPPSSDECPKCALRFDAESVVFPRRRPFWIPLILCASALSVGGVIIGTVYADPYIRYAGLAMPLAIVCAIPFALVAGLFGILQRNQGPCVALLRDVLYYMPPPRKYVTATLIPWRGIDDAAVVDGVVKRRCKVKLSTLGRDRDTEVGFVFRDRGEAEEFARLVTARAAAARQQPVEAWEQKFSSRSRIVECVGCGYPLNGLPEDHACPECGLSYDAYSTVYRRVIIYRISFTVMGIGACVAILKAFQGSPLPRFVREHWLMGLLVLVGGGIGIDLWLHRRRKNRKEFMAVLPDGLLFRRSLQDEWIRWTNISRVAYRPGTTGATLFLKAARTTRGVNEYFETPWDAECFVNQVRERIETAANPTTGEANNPQA